MIDDQTENGKSLFSTTGCRRPPTQLGRCTDIALDHNAGRLLSWLLTRSHRVEPGAWVRVPREDILRGSRLTVKQYHRARQFLVEDGHAEFETGWFDATKMVFARPTPAFLGKYAELCEPRPHPLANVTPLGSA